VKSKKHSRWSAFVFGPVEASQDGMKTVDKKRVRRKLREKGKKGRRVLHQTATP
jgi:hypothetical protein